MDGNGRWADRRGYPGRPATARAPRPCAASSRPRPTLGIGVLTLFAFSADNWRRPPAEVAWLMRLFREYLRAETARCVAQRRPARGHRPARPAGPPCSAAIDEPPSATTAGGTRLLLRIALDYSAPRRDPARRPMPAAGARCRPARRSAGCSPSWTTARRCPRLDLLIRTGGERRLSDFLLWEAAYAELSSPPQMWPEFGPAASRGGGAGLRGPGTPLRRACPSGGGMTMTDRTRQGLAVLSARRSPSGSRRTPSAARPRPARRRPRHRGAGARRAPRGRPGGIVPLPSRSCRSACLRVSRVALIWRDSADPLRAQPRGRPDLTALASPRSGRWAGGAPAWATTPPARSSWPRVRPRARRPLVFTDIDWARCRWTAGAPGSRPVIGLVAAAPWPRCSAGC